jgi:putative RNA 2'-phosphotransferase
VDRTPSDPTALDEAQLVAISKLLSKILRHEPELVGVRLDAQGWVRVQELVDAIGRAARSRNATKRLRSVPQLTREVIRAVVALNDKQRFALSPDGERVRAVQGHSVTVDLKHPVREPPEFLFHGTASANWRGICAQGLKRGQRHAVHLSPDVETAQRVGARHGRPLVLQVAAAQMRRDGVVFTLADNGVWLVPEVAPKYLNPLASVRAGLPGAHCVPQGVVTSEPVGEGAASMPESQVEQRRKALIAKRKSNS